MASLQIFSSRGESSLLKKSDPQLNDVIQENGNISQSRGSKQRRSIREREHNTDVGSLQSRHKKVGSFIKLSIIKSVGNAIENFVNYHDSFA